MRFFSTLALAASVLAVAAGCPKAASWEIAEKALGPHSDLEKAEVHRELQRALHRAEEEILDDPQAAKPYVTKAQILWMRGDRAAAIETLHDALTKAKPKTEAQRERIKLYLMWAYKEAGLEDPDMLKKGIRFVEGLIKEDSMKTVYCYHMGVYYRRLHELLGEGVYKNEANRWFLMCTELDPEIVAELKKEGLYDPFME